MPHPGGSALGANDESWPSQNWMPDGQTWLGPSRDAAVRTYLQPNMGVVSIRGPHTVHMPAGPHSIGFHGSRPINHGLHMNYGHSGRMVGRNVEHVDLGYSYGARPRSPIGVDPSCGPSGSVRPRLSSGPNCSEPNANCVRFSKVPWRIKP